MSKNIQDGADRHSLRIWGSLPGLWWRRHGVGAKVRPLGKDRHAGPCEGAVCAWSYRAL